MPNNPVPVVSGGALRLFRIVVRVMNALYGKNWNSLLILKGPGGQVGGFFGMFP